jgi:rhodanese-related sulfurtransferase
MIDNPARGGGGGKIRSLLVEALLVAAVGVAFAFLANYFSPRGLKLARHYSSDETPGAAHPLSGGESIAEQLRSKGLHLADRAQAEQLFRDPRRRQNAILFIDARDEEAYQQGHIPGACEFFPYYPEKYIAAVRPLCDVADQIVVYCTGGQCEDSQAAALYLRDSAGVPGEKLFVYVGGITEWEAAGLPLERGERDSGDILEGAK